MKSLNIAFNYLKKQPWIAMNAAWLIFVACVCFLGPYFYPHNYHEQNLLLGPQAPSWSHWFGTDVLGRDLLARILYGGRVSILIGCISSFIAISIGVSYGAISGYVGGKTDSIMMRIIDVLYPLPFTLLVILLMALFGRNILLLLLAIASVKWLTMARIIRGQTCTLVHSAFVQCAQCMGQSSFGIWYKHLLPNLAGTILVYGTLMIPNVILEEAFVSFLGLGIQPPLSSWGVLIFEGARNMEEYPWLLIFPCVFFSGTLFSLNFIGDALRDYLDPVRR